MDYQVWIDGDGKYHDLSDMSTDYIRACIKQLELVIRAYHLDTDSPVKRSQKAADDKVLHRNWSIDHALNYLSTFQQELKSRK